ncbi:MAG: PTS fructose transporter subunit IIA [Methylococcales bacterium]|jgi:mannose PTS system EIIA component|nr:PTS fructose transporter subunit IIA [Methylococcales bacterium]MBT7410245.1 PTS fructose transporter subunit IIA [Methylococcales bacterium]
MKVSILIVTHSNVGNVLLNAAKTIMVDTPSEMSCINIWNQCDVELEISYIDKMIQTMDKGEGVLILNDLYGATPCNILFKFLERQSVRVVTGLNLSMLLTVMNYSGLSLDDLMVKAIEGGKSNVFDIKTVLPE